jgi:hypothetical protein
MEIKLPEYISISDYKKIVSLEHLTESEQMLARIAILTKNDISTVRGWTGNKVAKITDQITDLLNSTKPEFYPLIEFEGKTYGFSTLSKMTLGEYIDIENLCRNVNENLSQLMALMYREVTNNKFDTFQWKLKSRVKLALGKTEDLFKYYKIKPYDSDDLPVDAEVFEQFPVKYLLGALFFFTLIKTEYLKNTLLSLTPNSKETTMMMEKEMEQLLLSIGDGLAQFMVSAKPISFQSQETNVLLT